MVNLEQEIAALPSELRATLDARGFASALQAQWAAAMKRDRDERNRLRGTVTEPEAADLMRVPIRGTPEHARLEARGLEALAAGKVALCVLAGGMATRMGGVVKALVEALPGRTFLDLRLAQAEAIRAQTGGYLPVWLMTSQATDGPIRDVLAARGSRDVHTFEQCVALRLDPSGALFRDETGSPSVYATGHGDLPDALRKSGLLDAFVSRGGEWVLIANLDNLGATLDPAMVGLHLELDDELTVEVVDKVGSDRGGVPVRHDGRRIIAEEFRLPKSIDPARIRVFNTNTFWVRARALAELSFSFTYVEVDKTIDGRKAVQFERLLGEITMGLATRFLHVPRDGAESRFLPVKDNDELARRRPEIEAVVAVRFGAITPS